MKTTSSVMVNDSIEVIDEKNGMWARVRVVEHVHTSRTKASVLLTPDELEQHANACLKLAADMRERR